MEELFETFDLEGSPLGLMPRSRVHREGIWHRAANVFLFRSDGRLLIQRRQHGKDVLPGSWDLSAAEHLKPGESYREGAARGLREELGIEAHVELEPIGEVTMARLEIARVGIKDYEFQQSFRAVYDGPVSPDVREVMVTALVSRDELAVAFAERPEDFTPWFRRRVADLDLFRHW